MRGTPAAKNMDKAFTDIITLSPDKSYNTLEWVSVSYLTDLHGYKVALTCPKLREL
jgi:hypothetical protein